jgi:hypothetical protein
MSFIVFLRAVNVGGTNRCQPAVLAKQLAGYDVLNIGAVGTFVVRKDVSNQLCARPLLESRPSKKDWSAV